jgi:hypothetical protein
MNFESVNKFYIDHSKRLNMKWSFVIGVPLRCGVVNIPGKILCCSAIFKSMELSDIVQEQFHHDHHNYPFSPLEWIIVNDL